MFHIIGGAGLLLGTLLQPLAIVHKINLNGVQFGLHYFLLFIFLSSGVVPLLNRIYLFVETRVLLLCVLPFLGLLICTINLVPVGFFLPLVFGLSMCFFSMIYGLTLQKEKFAQFGEVVLKCGIMICVLGWLLYIANIPLFDSEVTGSSYYFMNSGGKYRAMSVFLNPNSFAYFLVFMFCILLSFNQMSLTYRIAVGSLLIYLLFASGSRSAMAATMFVWLISIISRKRSNIRIALVCGLVVALLLALVSVLSNLTAFINMDVRAEKWLSGLEIYSFNARTLMFGVPTGIDLNNGKESFSDNFYLLVLFRTGIVGFIFFSLLCSFLLFLAIRQIFASVAPLEKAMSLFILGAMILMFFSNFLLFTPINMLFGISVGVLTAGYTCRRSICGIAQFGNSAK